MRVLVKGDKYQAAQAAADRKIPFVFRTEIRDPDFRHVETVGEVPRAFHDLVSQWFCEDGEAPFPIGSCLHYSL